VEGRFLLLGIELNGGSDLTFMMGNGGTGRFRIDPACGEDKEYPTWRERQVTHARGWKEEGADDYYLEPAKKRENRIIGKRPNYEGETTNSPSQKVIKWEWRRLSFRVPP
jgi:hypothetical protein